MQYFPEPVVLAKISTRMNRRCGRDSDYSITDTAHGHNRPESLSIRHRHRLFFGFRFQRVKNFLEAAGHA